VLRRNEEPASGNRQGGGGDDAVCACKPVPPRLRYPLHNLQREAGRVSLAKLLFFMEFRVLLGFFKGDLSD